MALDSCRGTLRKMHTALDGGRARYELPVGEQRVAMNPLIGSAVSLRYSGEIFCIHCGRRTGKSFNQGYCFPCFRDLARCDSCIVSPEKCHYFEGTCREPEWADQHCMTDHIVYLANSSGIKVGITRAGQVPTRWIDQGAVEALPVFRVRNRLQSGVVEVLFKNHVADKTSWQAMLKGEPSEVNLEEWRDSLLAECETGLTQLRERFGADAIEQLPEAEPTRIGYPVETYPQKVKSFNLDKTPLLEGKLLGIKGQYLILDTGVINIRKFGGYHVEFICHDA